MIIEIDDDCVDSIIQNALVRDYIYLSTDLKINAKNPGHLHEDDAAAYEDVVKALEVLGNWYFAFGEFDKAVKKAKK